MGKYWKLLAWYNAETTAYSACVGAEATSPYTPEEDARLIGLRTICSYEDVASIYEAIQFKLTHAAFKPNSIEVGAQGTGLHTAPALNLGAMDWVVDQNVKAGVPMTIEGRNITVETPLTVEVFLWGLFES